MKKRETTMLLLLFCGGVVGGLLLPRWLFLNGGMELAFLNTAALREYQVLRLNYFSLLREVAVNRITLFLLLFFSSYTAAGIWILSGAAAFFGLSMGMFAALLVMQMKYWGMVFGICALTPHWFFYGVCGRELAFFLLRRRERTLLCNENVAPSYNKKVFLDFLKMLGILLAGIAAEVYINPWILKLFFKIYK